MISRDSSQERKWKLLRRTEFRLKQGMDRIDFEEDVLLPEIEALKAGKPVMGLPEGAVFDIKVIHENRTPTPHADPEK